MRIFLVVLLFSLAGCTGIPDNVRPVNGFKVDRYMGKWYEIARLDHSFEKGLSRVSAEYALDNSGGVTVLNRGYSAKNKAWKEARGIAYFVNSPDQGYLKVSFFGPFYGSYVIFELDHEAYQYALVCGYDKSYLWILAREPKIKDDVRDRLIAIASEAGFKTENLIFVSQE